MKRHPSGSILADVRGQLLRVSMRRCLSLEYRGNPSAEPFDPGSQRLSRIAAVIGAICWTSALVGTLSPEPLAWAFILVSLVLAVVGSGYAIGATLNRRVPRLAWIAVAGLSSYWIVLLGVIIHRFVNASGELKRFLYLFF